MMTPPVVEAPATLRKPVALHQRLRERIVTACVAALARVPLVAALAQVPLVCPRMAMANSVALVLSLTQMLTRCTTTSMKRGGGERSL